MPHDVFISFASQDEKKADRVCAALEEDSIPCWLAKRDIIHGEKWTEAIVYAIKGTNVVVLVLSRSANNSPWVEKEVFQALQHNKMIISFRVEKDIPLSPSLSLFLGGAHHLDASKPPLTKHLRTLKKSVKALLYDLSKASAHAEQKSDPPAPPSRLVSLLFGGTLRKVITIIVIVVAIAGGGFGLFYHQRHSRSIDSKQSYEPEQYTYKRRIIRFKANDAPDKNVELYLQSDAPSLLIWQGEPLLISQSVEDNQASSSSATAGVPVPSQWRVNASTTAGKGKTWETFAEDGGLIVTILFEMGRPRALIWKSNEYAVVNEHSVARLRMLNSTGENNTAFALQQLREFGSSSRFTARVGNSEYFEADLAEAVGMRKVPSGATYARVGKARSGPGDSVGPPDKRAVLPQPVRLGAFRVVGVENGDTIRVVNESGSQYRVRLRDIAAPKRGQDFSHRSRQALASLLFGESVDILSDEWDEPGCVLGKAFHNGRDAGLLQVQLGMAWHYSPKRQGQLPREAHVYEEAEIVAKLQRRGLWQQREPKAPWLFGRPARSPATADGEEAGGSPHST